MDIHREVDSLLAGVYLGNPGVEQQIRDFLCVVERDPVWESALIQSNMLSDRRVYVAWAMTPMASSGREREYVAQLRVVEKGKDGWIVCPPSPCGEVE